MADFNAGRVYADVLPNLKGFKAAIEAEAKKLNVRIPVEFVATKKQLTAEVKRASTGVVARIPVEFVVSKADLKRKIKAATAGVEAKIGVDVSKVEAISDTKAAVAAAEAAAGDIDVKLDIDTTKVLAEIAALRSLENIDLINLEQLKVADKQLANMVRKYKMLKADGVDQIALDNQLNLIRARALSTAQKELRLTDLQIDRMHQWNTAAERFAVQRARLSDQQNARLVEWSRAATRLENDLGRLSDQQNARLIDWSRAATKFENDLTATMDKRAKLLHQWNKAASSFDARQPAIDASTRSGLQSLEKSLVSARTKMRGLRNDWSSFDAFATRTLSRVALGFAAIPAAAAVAFAGVSAAAVASFAEVEQVANQASQVWTFDELAKRTDLGADQIESAAFRINRVIREQIIEAALDVAKITIFDTAEIEQGVLAFAQAGIKVEDGLEAVEVAAKLAQAGGADLVETSNLLVQGFLASGQAASTFGDQAEGLGDKLVYVANQSSQNVVQALQAFQNGAASAFAQAGQSVDETLNAIELLGDVGVQGLTAGTQLSILIRDLGKASSESASAWQKYGVEVVDAEGKTRSFAQIADELTEVFDKNAGTNIQKQRELAKELGFQFRSFRSLQQLMGAIHAANADGGSAYLHLLELQRESVGSLDLQSQLALDTLSAQWETFKNNLSATLRVFAGPIANALTDFFKRMTGFGKEGETTFDRLEEKALAWGEAVGKSLDSFLRRMEGPEGKKFFADISSGLKDMLLGVKEFFQEFADGFSGSEGPQKTFVTALGEIVREFGELSRRILPEIGEQLGKAFKWIADNPDFAEKIAKGFIAAAAASKSLKLLLLPIAGLVLGIGSAAKAAAGFVRLLSKAFGLVVRSSIVAGLGSLAGDLLLINRRAKVATDSVKTLAAVNATGGFAMTNKGTLVKSADDAGKAASKGFWAGFAAGLVNFLPLGRVGNAIKRLLPERFAAKAGADASAAASRGFLGGFTSRLTTGVREAFDKAFRSVGRGFFERFGARGAASTLGRLTASLGELAVVLAAVVAAGAAIKGTFDGFIKGAGGAQHIADTVMPILRDFGDIAVSTGTILKDKLLPVIEKTNDVLLKIVSPITQVAGALGGALLDALKEVTDAFEEIGEAAGRAWDKIAGRTGDAVDGLADKMRDLAGREREVADSADGVGVRMLDISGTAADLAGGMQQAEKGFAGFNKELSATGSTITRTFGGANITRSLRDNFAAIADQASVSVGRISAEYKAAVETVRKETGNLAGSLTSQQVTRALQIAEFNLGKAGIAAENLGKGFDEAAGGASGFGEAYSGIAKEIEGSVPKIVKAAHAVNTEVVKTGKTGIHTIRAVGVDVGSALGLGTADGINQFRPAAGAAAKAVTDKVVESFKSGKTAIETAAREGSRSLINPLIEGMASRNPEVKAAGAKTATTLVDSVKNVLSNAKDGLISLGKSILSFFQNEQITNLQKRLDEIKRTVGNLGEMLTAAKKAADQITKTLISALKTYAPRLAASFAAGVKALGSVAIRNVRLIAPTLRNAGRAVINALRGGIQFAAEKVLYPAMRKIGAQAMRTIGENAKKAVAAGKIVSALIDAGKSIIKHIRAGMTLARPTIGEHGTTLINQVPRALAEAVAGISANLNTIGRRIIGHIRNGMSEAAPFLYKHASDIAKEAGRKFRAGYKPAYDAGVYVMEGLEAGLTWGMENLIKPFIINKVAPWIREHKGPISFDRQLLRPAGEAIMEGFHTGLNDGFGEIKSFITEVGPYVADLIDYNKFWDSSAEFIIGNAKLGFDDDFVAMDHFKNLLPDVPLGLHPTTGLADTTAMAKKIADFYNLDISSLFRPGAITSSGNVSQHALGQAADFVGSGAALTRASSGLSLLIDKVFKQIIWLNTLWRNGLPGFGFISDHLDHMHAGWTPAGKRAQGGKVLPGRSYVVGERGPELMIADRSGSVISAKDFHDFLLAIREMSPRERLKAYKERSEGRISMEIHSNSADPTAVAAQVGLFVKGALSKVKR